MNFIYSFVYYILPQLHLFLLPPSSSSSPQSRLSTLHPSFSPIVHNRVDVDNVRISKCLPAWTWTWTQTGASTAVVNPSSVSVLSSPNPHPHSFIFCFRDPRRTAQATANAQTDVPHRSSTHAQTLPIQQAGAPRDAHDVTRPSHTLPSILNLRLSPSIKSTTQPASHAGPTQSQITPPPPSPTHPTQPRPHPSHTALP